MISPDHQWLVELDQPLLPSIAELAEPEVAVAGFRINQKSMGRPAILVIEVFKYGHSERTPLSRFPFPMTRISVTSSGPQWKKLAFTLTKPYGLELWILDLAEGIPRQLTDATLNAAYGVPYRWQSNEALLCKFVPADRGHPPIQSPVPTGYPLFRKI